MKPPRNLALLSLLGSLSLAAADQQSAPPPSPITLEAAVHYAAVHFPEARAALARVVGARAAVGLARTAYLPRTDLLWQTNRATYNNIAGLLLPQSVIPPLSGPVLTNTNNTTAWASAGGVLLSWQPFDFGLRSANVDVARAAEGGANFQLQLTKLDVAAAAADAFLATVVTQQARRAAEADVNRRESFAKVVHVLVGNQLRAGVEASRADAELAAARTQLLRAQGAEENSRVALAEALGIAGQLVQVDPGPLATALPPAPNTTESREALTNHPLAELAMSAVDQFRAREHALQRSYFPSFYLQSALAGRGSGVQPNGTIVGGSNGLAPDRANFAIGLTASFPVFDFFSLRSRNQIEAANEQSASAEYDKTIQQLTAQLQRARTDLTISKQIADNTAVELQSAQMTETQAEARYRAALANVVEVAEAQRLLVQAESDDAIAKVSVWRALLAQAFAEGNLQPFIDAVQNSAGGHQ